MAEIFSTQITKLNTAGIFWTLASEYSTIQMIISFPQLLV